MRRVVIETACLAQVVGQRGVGEQGWQRIRAEAWERSLRDAGLLEVVERLPDDVPATLASQLRTIRDRLVEVRELEQRLGEDAEQGGTISRREHDGVVIVLCVVGVLAAAAPAELAPLVATAFALYGGRALWREYGPKVKVGREQLAASRQGLARAIQSFLEHTWVAAVGDRVLESTPHAIYLKHRLDDLDIAAGGVEDRAAELRALMARIRQANASLGRAEDDAETARLARQLEDVQGKLSLLQRLREDCLSRSDAHLAQLDRQRAIAARRALSSKVSNLVYADSEDASGQQIAVIEVDIADIAARLRGLEVEISGADAELRSVLEVRGASMPGARSPEPRRKSGATTGSP